jgi:hypothetical protein
VSVGDDICLHPSPVGKRAAAGTGDLPGQQLDDAVVLSVVARVHDSVSVPITEPKQSGLLDGGS